MSEQDQAWTIVEETYIIKGILGKGAYGSVYVGEHRLSGQNVAIKQIDQI